MFGFGKKNDRPVEVEKEPMLRDIYNEVQAAREQANSASTLAGIAVAFAFIAAMTGPSSSDVKTLSSEVGSSRREIQELREDVKALCARLPRSASAPRCERQ